MTDVGVENDPQGFRRRAPGDGPRHVTLFDAQGMELLANLARPIETDRIQDDPVPLAPHLEVIDLGELVRDRLGQGDLVLHGLLGQHGGDPLLVRKSYFTDSGRSSPGRSALGSGDARQNLEQLRRAWPDAPVVGQPVPDDAPVTAEDEGRGARDVSADPAARVPQAEGVDRLVVGIGQQAELDSVGLGEVAAVFDLVAADGDDLGVQGADAFET